MDRTLTAYNSEYSDHPFDKKRDMTGGFKESPLRLNVGLGRLTEWNEDTIKDRANRLADLALGVWRAATLPPDILAAYRPRPDRAGRTTVYTIEDHPHLLTATMRDIFEEFRKEALALDPCVTEEFLKLYVAFKAETNFVDVIPQANAGQMSGARPGGAERRG